MTDPRLSVLIVDDHYATRFGLKIILEHNEDMTISEAETGSEALSLAASLKPDVVVLDFMLPGMSGIDTAIELKKSLPEQRILMLTGRDDEDVIFAALSAGVDGYCLKDSDRNQIVSAVRAVSLGAGWLDPLIAKQILRYMSRLRVTEDETPTPDKVTLSKRENEILELIVNGLSNQEIAKQLQLSTQTIKTHVRRLLEKLMVTDRTQAAVKALRDGLIDNARSQYKPKQND
ncbi:MAG TPA: response regulator transcription factor [Drouetiella sp.]|jgi:two-component system, NarL family, response regulator LiaR